MIGVAAGAVAGAAVAGSAAQQSAEPIVPASLTGDRGTALGGFAGLIGADLTEDERAFASEHADAMTSAFAPVSSDTRVASGRNGSDSVRQLSNSKDNVLLRPGR
jgi:hypothetical protein